MNKKKKKKKFIIGNWRAREDSSKTQIHNEDMREFCPDYTNEYPVWVVEEYIKDSGTMFVADCGCHKNSEKNAKEIVESHNRRISRDI